MENDGYEMTREGADIYIHILHVNSRFPSFTPFFFFFKAFPTLECLSWKWSCSQIFYFATGKRGKYMTEWWVLQQKEQGHMGAPVKATYSLPGGWHPKEALQLRRRKGTQGFRRLRGAASATARGVCLTQRVTPSPSLPPGPGSLLGFSHVHRAQTHTYAGSAPWPPLGMVLQGGKLLEYLTGTRISLWKISSGSNRWLIPWALSRKSVSKIAQTHMQKSYQYVRICIYVNLLSLFLDITSYLIMVTSVEEESSFPLPEQNRVQGSFGEIACCRVYGRWANPH